MSTFPKGQFENAVLVFSHYLGINIEEEPELVAIAEDALINLPEGWELGIGDTDGNEGIPYFFNVNDGTSAWVHPLEKRVFRLVKEERKRLYGRSNSRPNKDVTEDFNSFENDRGDMHRQRHGQGNSQPYQEENLVEDFEDNSEFDTGVSGRPLESTSRRRGSQGRDRFADENAAVPFEDSEIGRKTKQKHAGEFDNQRNFEQHGGGDRSSGGDKKRGADRRGSFEDDFTALRNSREYDRSSDRDTREHHRSRSGDRSSDRDTREHHRSRSGDRNFSPDTRDVREDIHAMETESFDGNDSDFNHISNSKAAQKQMESRSSVTSALDHNLSLSEEDFFDLPRPSSNSKAKGNTTHGADTTNGHDGVSSRTKVNNSGGWATAESSKKDNNQWEVNDRDRGINKEPGLRDNGTRTGPSKYGHSRENETRTDEWSGAAKTADARVHYDERKNKHYGGENWAGRDNESDATLDIPNIDPEYASGKPTTKATSAMRTDNKWTDATNVAASSTAVSASIGKHVDPAPISAFSPQVGNDQHQHSTIDVPSLMNPAGTNNMNNAYSKQQMLSDAYRDLQMKYSILESRNRHLEIHVKQSEKEFEELSDRNAVLSRSTKSLEEQLENHRSDSVSKEKKLQLQHDDVLKELRENHDHAMNELKRNEENKYSEMIKRLRKDAEEDMSYKVKGLERTHNEELNTLRLECAANKRLLNDIENEYSTYKNTIETNKEKHMGDASKELHKLKLTNMELTEKYDAAKLELKKMREEQIQLSSKLTSTLQLSQISVAECESAKIESKSALMESQSATHALTQAMQRLHVADDEIVKLKSEILQLKNENDAYSHQLMKQQLSVNTADNKLTMNDAELKKFKINAQAENARLNSRIAELESYLTVQRKQLDDFTLQDNSSVKELSMKLDKSEYEVLRYKEKCVELQNKSESSQNRILSLEKEIATLRDELDRKERLKKEDKKRVEESMTHIEEKCQRLEHEVDDLRSENHLMKMKLMEAEKSHKADIIQLHREVAEKVPQLTSNAVAKVEQELKYQYDSECEEIKRHYEAQLKKFVHYNEENLSLITEKEARQRITYNEDRMELEKCKYQLNTFKRRNEDLELQLEEKNLEIRKLTIRNQHHDVHESHHHSTPGKHRKPKSQSYRYPPSHMIVSSPSTGPHSPSQNANEELTNAEGVRQSSPLKRQQLNEMNENSIIELNNQLLSLKRQLNSSISHIVPQPDASSLMGDLYNINRSINGNASINQTTDLGVSMLPTDATNMTNSIHKENQTNRRDGQTELSQPSSHESSPEVEELFISPTKSKHHGENYNSLRSTNTHNSSNVLLRSHDHRNKDVVTFTPYNQLYAQPGNENQERTPYSAMNRSNVNNQHSFNYDPYPIYAYTPGMNKSVGTGSGAAVNYSNKKSVDAVTARRMNPFINSISAGTSGGIVGSTNKSKSRLHNNSASKTNAFSSEIYDGGYHEGYWRTKYDH